MKHSNRRCGRFVAVALVGSFLFGLAPSGLAAEAATPAMAPRPTLTDAAVAKAASLDSDALSLALAQAAPPAQASTDGGFFKTGKGKAAVILFVATTGLVVYSKYNDRVKSGIR